MNIGITGHQNLGDAEMQIWIKHSLINVIENVKPSRGLTSLARGADQLFAELLIQQNVPYTAVIPCEGYDSTFETQTDLTHFQFLLNKALKTTTLGFIKPTEEAFLEAGKYIVDHCNILVAIWDGQAAKGLGGTGDIVRHALTTNKKIIHINPKTKDVKELAHGEK